MAVIKQYVRDLESYTIDQLRWKRTDDVWSIGQLYVHMVEVANEYIGYIEACAKETQLESRGKTEDGLTAFAERMWPDVRVKLEEPANATHNPESKEGIHALLEQVLEKLYYWAERVDQINPACKARHGWFGWLNAREWFEMVGMHSRHHLRQKAILDKLLAEYRS